MQVRFLQSYNQRGTNAPGSTATATEKGGRDSTRTTSHDVEAGRGVGPGVGDRGARAGDSGSSREQTEARYGQLYEARINPFTQFSRLERRRKYEELTVAEKITLSTTRMFLGNKFARCLNFVFFYVVVLHLVVFFTLQYWSHSH
ncbi:unnamed protein product, partial [Hapterophycus canaliculatus]